MLSINNFDHDQYDEIRSRTGHQCSYDHLILPSYKTVGNGRWCQRRRTGGTTGDTFRGELPSALRPAAREPPSKVRAQPG